MDSVFLLDGKVYNVEVEKGSLERSSAVTDTERSGRTLDYAADRDIIEIFHNHTMKVYPKTEDSAVYNTFYDVISDPNYASYEMIFPYGQEALIFQAYITRGKDKLKARRDKNIWGSDGLSLNFAAIEPQKRW